MAKEQPNIYLDQDSKACLDKAIQLLDTLYHQSNPDEHLDLLYYALHHRGTITDKIIHLVDHTDEPETKIQISTFPYLHNHRYKSENLIEAFNIQLADLIIHYQNKHEKILGKSAQQKLITRLGFHKPATLIFQLEMDNYDPLRILKINIHPLYQILHALHHLHEYEIALAYSESLRPSRYTVLQPTLAKSLKKNTPVKYEINEKNEITITGHNEVLHHIYHTIETLLRCKEHNIIIEVLADAPTLCERIYKTFEAIEYKNSHKQNIDLQIRIAIHRISCMIHDKKIITQPIYQQN
ncbi:hypothetical protein [Pedobacter sp. HMWF019]|uniref:hypothetical protein n=1 Tax=Pedobacter sp. HMWF019 TaxID=2056856 RepID=UPI0011B20901|nr:hypothetical protein [Pedobacter sp. HMWF019]